MRDSSFVVIGNPESRRVETFGRTVRTATGRRPVVLAWTRVLRQQVAWDELPAGPLFVRLESPGKNWEVERSLLALGADQPDELDPDARRWSRLSAAECAALEPDHGRLLASRQWYLGWRAILQRVKAALTSGGRDVRWFVPPEAVATMFDKSATDAQLSQCGLPVPPGLGTPANFDDFLARLEAAGRKRAFLKLCHGSSASGALAFARRGGEFQAFTTVRLEGPEKHPRIYNVRPVRRLADRAEIARIADAICRERALAQAWVPKAGWQGARMDWRVVVLAGRVLFVVPRLARTPFTNLQLGARRGDPDALAAELGEERWQALLAPAVAAVRTFPGTLSAALDLAPEAGFRRSWILEMNAFGDDLPGWTAEGRNAQEWAIDAALGGIEASPW